MQDVLTTAYYEGVILLVSIITHGLIKHLLRGWCQTCQEIEQRKRLDPAFNLVEDMVSRLSQPTEADLMISYDTIYSSGRKCSGTLCNRYNSKPVS